MVKIPRKEIEVLSSEEAIKIALSQKEVQEVLGNDKSIVKTLYEMYNGYESVVNVVAKSKNPKAEALT